MPTPPVPFPVPISGPTNLKDDLDLKTGFAGSLVQIGGTLGSLTAGAFTKYGKKRCIHIANLISVIGCILIISSGPYGLKTDYPINGPGLPLLLSGRFIYGIGAGCFTVFVNKFISEVSPKELTGPMGIAF
jgi:MFS family permease